MFTSQPRVLVPSSVPKGQAFLVKALIGHAMETGLRYDEKGDRIPRKLVHTFTCRYAGETVFSIDMHESVAANPYVEFYLEATETGMLEFEWKEDGGASARLQHAFVVA